MSGHNMRVGVTVCVFVQKGNRDAMRCHRSLCLRFVWNM